MYIINQISVFAENKPGSLGYVINALSESGIDIRALSIADTKDFGIVRMIVSDADEAQLILNQKNILSNITSVVAAKVPDECGSLSKLLKLLSANNINLEYMYAFFSGDAKNAFMAFRVEDNEKMVNVLKGNGYEPIDPLKLGLRSE